MDIAIRNICQQVSPSNSQEGDHVSLRPRAIRVFQNNNPLAA